MSNPWFRMYSNFIFNETVEFLSFEDQRHFVFLLCMKNEGILDKQYPQEGMLNRVIARRLGLSGEAFDNAKRRIMEIGLIDENWQPVNWNERQFKSDTSKERTKAYRDRLKRHCDVTVTTQETDTDTDSNTETESDSETEKNPSAPQPTNAGLYCRSMMQNGIASCNPSHPTLLALIHAGASEEEFIAAAKSAVERGKPNFAYVLGTVKRQREEAAALVLHQGRMPTKQDLLVQENKESTLRAKARLFGSPTEKDVTNETTRL